MNFPWGDSWSRNNLWDTGVQFAHGKVDPFVKTPNEEGRSHLRDGGFPSPVLYIGKKGQNAGRRLLCIVVIERTCYTERTKQKSSL